MKHSLMKSALSCIIASSLLAACGSEKAEVSIPVVAEPATAASAQSVVSANPFAALTEKKINTPLLTSSDLPHYLERDIQDEVFYFVMPDRFQNGDKSNDLGSKTKPESAGGLDVTHKGMYHGGDMAGLKEKLPYLKELGITSIWMTPIMRNQAMQADTSGYHGYWILDFTEIDPHLGSNDELKALIDAAHEQNIKIFFDIITNHTADVIKYKECHGEDGTGWLYPEKNGCEFKSMEQLVNGDKYTPIIPKGAENLKTPAWLNDPKYYHNQGDSFWQGESSILGDFSGLDDVDTNNPFVVEGMTEIFKDIITEFKPDGFRIDTVKHVNLEFWQSFAPALVEHAKAQGIPKFFMFGEVFDGDPKNLSQFTTVGKMQSVLDFGFQGATHRALIEQKGTDELEKLFKADSLYNDEDSHADQLVTFVGNHDMGRFAYMVKNSEHNYDEAAQIQRTVLAHALMYFSRGIPVIYYGAEQGFVGEGGDQASRQDMMPSFVESYNASNVLATDKTTADNNFDQSHPFYQLFAEYAHMVHQHPALKTGATEVLYAQATPGMFAFTRKTKEQSLLVVFNTATSEQMVDFSLNEQLNAKSADLIYSGAGNTHVTAHKGDKLSVTVPELSFSVYQLNK